MVSQGIERAWPVFVNYESHDHNHNPSGKWLEYTRRGRTRKSGLTKNLTGMSYLGGVPNKIPREKRRDELAISVTRKTEKKMPRMGDALIDFLTRLFNSATHYRLRF